MKCSLTQNGEEMVTGYWYHYGNDFGEAMLFSGASVYIQCGVMAHIFCIVCW